MQGSMAARLLAAGLTALALTTVSAQTADKWPAKPVRMVVPFPTDDLEVLKALDPFIATELKVNDLWLAAFPMVTKGPEGHDVRPLKYLIDVVGADAVAAARSPER